MATYPTHEQSAPIAPARANSIRIRRMVPSDAAELERFYAALSAESRHLRFFDACLGINHGQSTSFCTPDHEHREGFVAVIGSHGRSNGIVGHLCLEPAGTATAEVAIAVADALQGRGIGHRLLAAGVRWARSVGMTRLTATTLPTNTPIRRLLGGIGYRTTVSAPEPDVAEIVIDLAQPSVAAA